MQGRESLSRADCRAVVARGTAFTFSPQAGEGRRAPCHMRLPCPELEAQTTSIGVDALNGPHGGGCISDPRSLRDLRAIHEPDRYIAAGILPEDVALAVTVKVAGLDDRPHSRGRADTRSPGDLRPVHQPHRHIAAGVAQQNVALPVAAEIP